MNKNITLPKILTSALALSTGASALRDHGVRVISDSARRLRQASLGDCQGQAEVKTSALVAGETECVTGGSAYLETEVEGGKLHAGGVKIFLDEHVSDVLMLNNGNPACPNADVSANCVKIPADSEINHIGAAPLVSDTVSFAGVPGSQVLVTAFTAGQDKIGLPVAVSEVFSEQKAFAQLNNQTEFVAIAKDSGGQELISLAYTNGALPTVSDFFVTPGSGAAPSAAASVETPAPVSVEAPVSGSAPAPVFSGSGGEVDKMVSTQIETPASSSVSKKAFALSAISAAAFVAMAV